MRLLLPAFYKREGAHRPGQYDHAMSEGLTRDDLVENLAEVSHKTYMRHRIERGDDPASLSPDVHPHDRERAEEIVQELKRPELVAILQESVSVSRLPLGALPTEDRDLADAGEVDPPSFPAAVLSAALGAGDALLHAASVLWLGRRHELGARVILMTVISRSERSRPTFLFAWTEVAARRRDVAAASGV